MTAGCKCISVVLALLTLVGCASTPFFKAPSMLTLTDGVYWSQHYHAYLDVNNNTAVRYQWTPASCIRGNAGLLPQAMSPAQPAGQHQWVKASDEHIVMQRLSDGIPVVFLRVEKLPRNCTIASVETASEILTVVAQTMQQFGYPIAPTALLKARLEAGLLDITLRESDVANNLTLFYLLSEALESSGDKHAFLMARDLGRFYAVGQQVVSDTMQADAGADAVAALRKQLLNNNVASACDEALWFGPEATSGRYVILNTRLHSLTEQAAYHESGHYCLQRALTRVAEELELTAKRTGHLPELVIDLRFNEGGSLLLASQFANSLVPRNEPLLTIEGHAIYMQRLPNLQGLYSQGSVLVSSTTASAAEHLANALEQRGFSITGGPTRGSLSPTTVRTLQNGWVLGLSMYPSL